METEIIQIRIAGEDEDLEKFRSWLPQAFLSLPRPLFFLAENKTDGEVIAMGSLRILGKKGNKTGRFQLFVLPEFRRQGSGTFLMQAMSGHAVKEGVGKMLAGIPIAEHSEESRFFESLDGFRVVRTLQYFEIKTDDAWAFVAPLAKRLFEKEKLPKGYEVVSLEQAKPRLVNQFVLEHLGGIPDALISRLQGGANGFLPKLSVVIRSAAGPVAVLLIRKGERGLVIDSRVVAPEVRGTWVNVALMYTFARKLRALGIGKVYFEGDDQLHKDTIKLARRFGGKLLVNNHLYGCDLKKPG